MAARTLSSRRALIVWRYGLTADRLARWVANRLPRRVVYFALIRGWAHATTGPWSHEEAPGVLADQVVQRWERG